MTNQTHPARRLTALFATLLLTALTAFAALTACAAPPAPPTPTPTPLPTATPALAALGADSVRFDNPTAGYSLRHPAGWVSENFMGLLALVASDDALLADALTAPSFADGALLVAIASPPDEPDAPDLAQLLGDETIVVLEGPAPANVGGVIGERVVATSTDPAAALTVLAVSVERDGWRYLFGGLTSNAGAAAYLPTLEAIVASISFATPQGVQPPDDTPAPPAGAALTFGAPLSTTLQAAVGYTLSVPAAQPVLLAAVSSADIVLTLYDAAGGFVAQANGNPSREPELLVVGAADAPATTWRVGVRRVTDDGAAAAADPAADPVPLIIQAQPVSGARAPIALTLAEGDALALYAVADDGRDIVIALNAADAALGFPPLIVDNQFADPEYTIVRDLPAGDYVVGVEAFEGEVGAYTLVATPLDPLLSSFVPSAAAPGLLFGETSDGGALTPNGVTRTPGAVAVRYAGTVTGGVPHLLLALGSDGADVILELLDGEQVLTSRVDSAGNGEPETLVWTPAADGPIGVLVGDLFGRTHTQAVAFFALTDAPPLDAPRTLTVSDSAAPIAVLLPADDSDVILTLTAADGTPVGSVDRAAGGGAEVFSLVGLPPGEYVVSHSFYAGSGTPALAVVTVDLGGLAP